MLWLLASFFLFFAWSAAGFVIVAIADSLLVRSIGPDTTPLWIAYGAMVFSTAVWPALLLIRTHGKRPLGRMIRGWVISFALLNLLFGTLIALSVTEGGVGMAYFGRDLSSAFDALLAGALYLAGIVASEVYVKRRHHDVGTAELEVESV
jgi:hypothetical protein